MASDRSVKWGWLSREKLGTYGIVSYGLNVTKLKQPESTSTNVCFLSDILIIAELLSSL